MFGQNVQRPIVNGDGSHLEVVAIFATVQGEGPRAGQPAIFIRLGGCNLKCKFCDTEFENFEQWDLDRIITEVSELKTIEKLVIISGGEPLRQPIELLCGILLDIGFAVQIETNGTLYRDLPAEVEIVCSPKVGTQIRKETAERINAYKYLVSNYREKYMQLPPIEHDREVYLQPIDEYDAEKSAENLKTARKWASERGYKLSIQMHKVMGLE